MNNLLSPLEIEKRLNTWADVTMLCLDLKRAAIRKRHPELSEDEIDKLVCRELSILKIKEHER